MEQAVTTDRLSNGEVQRHLAGLCYATLSGVFLTSTMLCAAIAPGYVLHGSAISDLGVLRETRNLFNATLVFTGLMNVVAGAALFWRSRRRLSLSLAVLGGIGAIGAGMVTLEKPGIHGLFALAAFVAFNLQIFATLPSDGIALRIIGAMLGITGLAFVGIMFVGDAGNTAIFGSIGHGGAERMIVYPPMLWLLLLGGYMLGSR